MTPAPRPKVWFTVALLAGLAAAWAALAAEVLVVVPDRKRAYDAFGLQLPPLTQAVFAACQAVGPGGWPLAAAGTVVVAATGLAAGYVRHRGRNPLAGTRLAVAVLGLLLAPGLVVAVAVALPAQKLAEGLSK